MYELTTNWKTVAVDLAKHVFQVAAEERSGKVVFEERLKSRTAFGEFVQSLAPDTELLLETGPGAQAWARMALECGLRARILPAQRVKEHRSGAKNDRKDTHALLRAGRDESIQAVPVKTVEALTMQAVHRVRSGYMRRRTTISNQVRGLLLEYGVAIRKGDTALNSVLERIFSEAGWPILPQLRELLAELWAEWQALTQRIDALQGELTRIARQDPACQRLMKVLGFGPIFVTALVCKQLSMERFPNSRQFAAYFGGIPEQHSSGARIRLGRMTRRGDRYIFNTALQGAHAVLRQVRADASDPLSRRLLRWKQRHGSKGAAIRLVNHNLRVAWCLLRRNETYRREGARMTPT